MSANIDGKQLKEMFEGGAKALELNRSLIDELNVFPVPDGDTGTNMSLTLTSAVREVAAANTDDLSEIALAFSKGALKGARGNSGVITSQIFKGFAVALDAKSEMTPKDLAAAMKGGTEIAYGAVTKPKEGTILTVVRVMSETATAYVKKHRSTEIEPMLEAINAAGEEILQKTPEMLPVLAKAGVVDAGGRGLLTVFEGFLASLTHTDVKIIERDKVKSDSKGTSDTDNAPKNADKVVSLDNDYENITFAYCTEFFVTHLNRTTTMADVDRFKEFLMTIGDCVIVVGDTSLVKVHVHTNNPDQALKSALSLGELDSIKIENMLEQHRKIYGEGEQKKEKVINKEFAMVSICTGDGMEQIFKDLLVDVTVKGGQTMNPSVYDILGAINDTHAKHVFVLPNNSNIILAAEQAKGLADVDVHVIPTTCMPEGISAALVFSPDAAPDENEQNMISAAKSVKSAEVTHAVRSTRMNGFSVKEGDIIGLANKKIVAKSASVAEATLDTVRKIIDGCEMLTLYYGENITEADAERMVEKIQGVYPDIEIASYFGGQQHYYYVISAE